MSGQGRDSGGRFAEKVTEQDILVVFDFENEPGGWLRAQELADGLSEHRGVHVTATAVRRRLNEMEEDGSVKRKDFGAHATGWQEQVGPRLAPDVEERIQERAEHTDRDEFVPLDDG